ncbi:MAG: hypothetical protein BIP78_0261 [Candidatus Bipolaricaulis sibiricus]|uniref:L-2-amino-thiazoline-4-carboxylic acid hydrolase n=1 Tax=Bipolaricaulis sibiricus TaxID=2501609 RepID=A0A410FS41_BIPS1|nr:MAG: hypothetical protein BIP78_0261 [Candidatus Bipolaricaulis sibiricus]
MSVRLVLAARWLPPFVERWMLDRVARVTNGALDELLLEHAPGEVARIWAGEGRLPRRMAARRAKLAQVHAQRVLALADALGEERAVELARARLFPVGVALGKDARRLLGVGNALDEVERAARVLYRTLGIAFRLDLGPPVRLVVERCALAPHYGPVTCRALSAVDEGVLAGLNPYLRMSFADRLTDGRPACVAEITRQDER